MSYVLNQLVKNNDKNVDSSIIDSTKHFLNKYYVPYEIQCFKKDCSKLLNKTCLFKQASNVKKSKEYKKYERFEKKKNKLGLSCAKLRASLGLPRTEFWNYSGPGRVGSVRVGSVRSNSDNKAMLSPAGTGAWLSLAKIK